MPNVGTIWYSTNPNLLICLDYSWFFGRRRKLQRSRQFQILPTYSQYGAAPRFGSLAEMVPAHYLDQDYCITCQISKRPKSWDILGCYDWLSMDFKTCMKLEWLRMPRIFRVRWVEVQSSECPMWCPHWTRRRKHQRGTEWGDVEAWNHMEPPMLLVAQDTKLAGMIVVEHQS